MPDIRVEVMPEIKVPRVPPNTCGLIPYKKGQIGNPNGRNGSKPRLLSNAYRAHLSARVPKEIAIALGIPETWKWADAITSQILKKAVGRISDKDISFVAITELRETTEGRNVDKPSLGQSNTELTALMSAMASGPVEAPIIDAEVSEPEVQSSPEVVEPEYEDEPEVIDYNQDDKPIAEG
jgi:hypothetical protein